MRGHILAGTFAEYYREKREELAISDNTHPPSPKIKPPAPVVRVPSLGDYEIQKHPAGFFSIRQKSSGEVMHSVSEPTEEANRLYIEQSNLKDRLTRGPIVVWDVGLGAGANAMAALRCFESVENAEPLHLVSFERDLDPLRLSLKFAKRFPHLHHTAPQAVLKKGIWESPCGRIRWD